MRDWVQYHNPDKVGPYKPEEGCFHIFTNKRLALRLLGDRVWLVSRKGKPPQYVLCERFVVDRVGEQLGRWRYFAEGSRDGESFSPLRRIDDKPWFERLKRVFRFGLTHIRDKEVVQGLLRSASQP